MNERIIIFDFGSQYTQLIARRIRELNVYCEIIPFNKKLELTEDIKGVILSGSPFSVKEDNAPQIDMESFIGKVPVLGVCYGAQYIANNFGGNVAKSDNREYGRANLNMVRTESRLMENVQTNTQVWMSHGDTIMSVPETFEVVATTLEIPIAGFELKSYDQPVFGIQFHPEVTHSTQGQIMLSNFVVNICKCSGDWTPESFVEETVDQIKESVGDQHVILGLSGGVDSTVAAELLHRAIGSQLTCIFVNNGLLRKNEYPEVLESYKTMGLNVIGVDATELFLGQLAGKTDPEEKRKTIGRLFIEVFEKEAKKIDNAKWLGQGTIYPDVIESVSVHGPSVTIKSHHNVGGLPEKLDLKVIEPLRSLFKDEVRRVGKTLNIPHEILGRHPFPGPGLAIRIIGEINHENVRVLQEADAIFIQGLKEHGLYNEVWQAATILLPIHSVGVMGDERTYEKVVALRAVTSMDGMTADWCHLPYQFLGEISTKIINKVKGVNRVVYDISTKPPATIEWE